MGEKAKWLDIFGFAIFVLVGLLSFYFLLGWLVSEDMQEQFKFFLHQLKIPL